MDAKDLRTDAAIGERSKDGPTKFPHVGTLLCGSNKNYQNISSNPLDKLDPPTTRPCAVIGPDRVLPPSTISDAYVKKGHYEPWPSTDNYTYRHPPEYPHKVSSYPSPLRNISPRQTFQENMQRIMVPPTYNSVNINEDVNFTLDRNTLLTKNSKLNGSTEPKYCDVPYSVSNISDNQKNIEMCVPNVTSSRNCPPMWHPTGVNIRPIRPYGASELYQYPEYTSCAGSRPMPVSRPQNAVNENTSHLYAPETYYHQGNIRFRPYPNVKERYPPTRYDYINNYPNPFNPSPSFPTQRFDLQKPMPPHPSYPQVPIKYLENKMNDSLIEGYQRHPQQFNYNLPYQNQLIHPVYGPMLTNSLQNKLYSYQPDNSVKTLPSNKVPYENNKVYLECESGRNKSYSVSESFYVNDMAQTHKSQVIIPNYPTMNMQQIPPHAYYRKTSNSSKNYEYASHLRHAEPSIITNNHLTRVTSEFSPITISPSESNTSIDNLQSQGNFEDCGYVSQSSTASLKSIESSGNRIMPGDIHRRFNYPFPHAVRTSPAISKSQILQDNNQNSKDKKCIDIRQFLEMWNEGDELNAGNTKEKLSQIDYKKDINKITQHTTKNQEQLYVLGSVNVPSEELGKYEHIQKVSKLPDNIKGCNNIELLKHFEEVIESSNLNSFSNHKVSSPRNFQPLKSILTPGSMIPARPVSPLDVEAKISQSVIHKEVGCNFEIKPCSPEMLNVEAAAPVQNILAERVIEKVSNPYQSPVSSLLNSGINCDEIKQNQVTKNSKTSSCKLVNTQCKDSINSIKANYSLQDLESNSGVCLASLPRLDNDIELNFPEVNQQFINANNINNDLQNISETKNLILNNITIVESPSNNIITPIKEPEKEFAKLSKYRKNKKSESGQKDCQSIESSQQMRTDSVIIKNPDNIRYLEETDCSSNNVENIANIQIESTNFNLTNIFESKDEMKLNDVKENILEASNEIAIDFSINKTHDLTSTENNQYEVDESIMGVHKTDEKSVSENNDITKSVIPPLNISHEEIETHQKTVDSVTLDKNSSKDYSKSQNFTKNLNLDTSSLCNYVNSNTDAVNNASLTPYQNETQLCMLLNEAQNNNISTNCKTINEVNILGDSLTKYNVEHDKISPQNTCDGQSITSPHSKPILCEQTNISKVSSDNVSHQSKIETQADIIQYKIENKTECNISQNNESILCEQINRIETNRDFFSQQNKIETQAEIIQNKLENKINCNITKNSEPILCKQTNISEINCDDFSHQNKIETEAENIQNELDDKVDCNRSQNSEPILCQQTNISEINSDYYSHHTKIETQAENIQYKLENKIDCNISQNSEPVLRLQTNISEINGDYFSHQTKIETQAENIQYKLENKIDCKISRHSETINLNDISISSTLEDSAYVSANLSNYDINKCIKRCILKKELFSPWIQKLLWCNEDIDFSISQSRIHNTNNAKNNLLSGSCESHSLSISNINYRTDSVETNTNSCKENYLNATKSKTSLSLATKDDSNESSNENLNVGEKENKTSLSTEEAVIIEPDEIFSKENCIISTDDTIKRSNIHTDHLLVDVVPHDVICGHNTQILSKEVNVGISASLEIHRTTLKRSLSDSALINITEESDHDTSIWSKKRRKNNGFRNMCTPSFISANLNTVQNNRRKSISSSVYKEDNLSFCIVIDNNYIITQENEEGEKISFSEISEDCLADIHNTQVNEEVDPAADIMVYPPEVNCEYSEPFVLEISDEKSLEQAWVDDIGCVETVVSDDIAEDVIISTPSSPKSQYSSECDESQSDIFNGASDHTEKVKYIYGDKMCNDDADLVETLYRTPQMNVNKTLTNRESHGSDDFDELVDEISSNSDLKSYAGLLPQRTITHLRNSVDGIINEERRMEISKEIYSGNDDGKISEVKNELIYLGHIKKTQGEAANSCELSLDSVFSNNHDGDSSSPEVSSTTSEEKSSTILLKITNYQGMRTSQLNDTNTENVNRINSCKFTETINYTNSNSPSKPRLLITKAAQKYIPPIKETLDDLKVKLPLPQHSLMKLKQLKVSKTEPKHNNSVKKEMSKKTKPKFEDVLKSIDEIQFKMHKERNRKSKKPVPKVVIKKNENGSHYTSASDKDYFNPDLTGRKWQPWVFIEKNYFIDKMATKNKSKAIFNHRKNTYVFADKFQKYKSVSSAKFIISQPKSDKPSIGQLKYTIRLKHSY